MEMTCLVPISTDNYTFLAVLLNVQVCNLLNIERWLEKITAVRAPLLAPSLLAVLHFMVALVESRMRPRYIY